MEPFWIEIQQGQWKKLKFRVELVQADDRTETFRIFARNKIVELRSNRPLFRKKGIKKRSPTWTLLSDNIYNSGILVLGDAIMDKLEPKITNSK